MAIAYRESGTGTASANATAAYCYKPAGVQEGDLMFALISRYSDASDPSSVPSGWTLLAKESTDTHPYWLYSKVATGSEPSGYSWGFVNGRRTRCAIHVYYGDGIEVATVGSVGWENTTTTANVVAPGISVAAGELVVMFADSYVSSARTYTPPSGFDERYDAGDTASDMYHLVADKFYSSAGSTGDITATLSSTSSNRGGVLVAFAALEGPTQLLAPLVHNHLSTQGVV